MMWFLSFKMRQVREIVNVRVLLIASVVITVWNKIKSYILVLKNLLLWLLLNVWSLNVVSLNSKLWPLHGQRVQALQNKNIREKIITFTSLHITMMKGTVYRK